MTEIKSHNSSSMRTLKSLLVPSIAEVLLYLFSSILLLTLLKASAFWHEISAAGSNSTATSSPSAIYNLWTSFSQGRTLQILFWVIVGAAVYGLIWFGWNIVNNVRNDVVAADYMHPRSYDSKRYWESVLSRKMFFAISIVVLIVYIILSFQLFSARAGMSYDAIKDFSLAHSLTVLATSIVAGTLSIYFLVVLGRVVGNSWQSIYKDL